MSIKPANEPAHYKVVVKKPSYSWWYSSLAKQIGCVAFGNALLFVVLRLNLLSLAWIIRLVGLDLLVLISLSDKYSRLNRDLLKCASEGNLDKIKLLLAQGAYIHTRNQEDNIDLSPLADTFFESFINMHLKLRQQKQKAIYDFYTRNQRGKTALLLSAKGGHLACVKFLHQQGASIHARDWGGNTALHLSAWKDCLPCVAYLVEQGANIDAEDNDGNTALHLSAVFTDDLPCVQYLVAQGADIQATNNHGSTVLHLSAKLGDLRYVKYLHEQGADINAKDNDGKTALMISESNGYSYCVNYLIQHGSA